MRSINFDKVAEAVRAMCMSAACDLPEDVLQRIEEACQSEPFDRAKIILEQILQNAEIGARERIPICQDTGFAVIFVTLGDKVKIEGGTLEDALNEGTRRGYRDGYLRKSIVDDPLFDRKNTGDNTPAIIHTAIVEGDKLKITLLPKGGGCENMSYLGMLKPADGKEGVIDFVKECIIRSGGNPCPPVVVGIGIGGTADKASYLAKKALLRRVGEPHRDQRYSQLEKELLKEINTTGVGPLGLGGETTALAVHIEHFPCHIASMPVAVSLNCHSARKASVIL
ncbi:MAG: fumarate hydratase [Chitinispirillaceae bacterium]